MITFVQGQMDRYLDVSMYMEICLSILSNANQAG